MALCASMFECVRARYLFMQGRAIKCEKGRGRGREGNIIQDKEAVIYKDEKKGHYTRSRSRRKCSKAVGVVSWGLGTLGCHDHGT